MARGRPSKKQQLLDTARQLFAEYGYQGTSIDLVVQTAGVSKPTVYNNFPTKQALLQEMLVQVFAELNARREDILQTDKPTAEVLVALYSLLAEQPSYLMMYRILFGELHKLDADTRQLISEFDQQLQQQAEDYLRAAGMSDTAVSLLLPYCFNAVIQPALAGSGSVTAPVETALIAQVNALITTLK